MSEGTRTCAHCGEDKPLDNYQRTNQGELHTHCKACLAAKMQQGREDNRRTVARTERARKRLSRQRADPSPEEYEAVEEMAEMIIAHRNGELPKSAHGKPEMVPIEPVDALREEVGLSWPRWHRLCSIAVDIADARMMGL